MGALSWSLGGKPGFEHSSACQGPHGGWLLGAFVGALQCRGLSIGHSCPAADRRRLVSATVVSASPWLWGHTCPSASPPRPCGREVTCLCGPVVTWSRGGARAGKRTVCMLSAHTLGPARLNTEVACESEIHCGGSSQLMEDRFSIFFSMHPPPRPRLRNFSPGRPHLLRHSGCWLLCFGLWGAVTSHCST